MRNTGILLFLAGIYIVINSGSFRDLLFGKADIGFLTPYKPRNSGTYTSPSPKAGEQREVQEYG